MAESTFLGKVAEKLLSFDSLPSVTVVLPNRRARVFLLRELQSRTQQNIFAPKIISIEDLVGEMAALRQTDSIETLFEFYKTYLELTPGDTRQSFEQFANWGKVILKDFNEIDRYLLDPKHILDYLTDIERIKQWSPANDKPTELVEKYLHFWSRLPDYYADLYSRMKLKGAGYQGMIYREAVANLEHYTTANSDRHYVFAGLNALNAAEERIIRHLLEDGNADVFWDADKTFLNDDMHDAGLFLRRFKNSWSWYNGNPFEWIFDDFACEKNIEIIGTPKSVGQARILGRKLEEIICSDDYDLSRTAVILGEENLLLPVLYSLPQQVGALNITMGYPAKNNPAQTLVAKLFKLHMNAIRRNSSAYMMYYKDVLEVLTHPLVEPHINASNLVQIINRDNYSFISLARTLELSDRSPLFDLIFTRWEMDPIDVLSTISSILVAIRDHLGSDESDKVSRAFLYSIYTVINKLQSFLVEYPGVADLEVLHALYKQVIDLAEVSFEGEPLEGVQLMGVLESRALDFDTVIIASTNEGRLPAGKSDVSFIPYDVKREFNLPTYKEKDAIYSYHFYRVLQRAKNIILLYNTDNEGLDGGEKSRFITQLEVEKQPAHHITHIVMNPEVPKVAHEPVEIPKSELVMERLREIASNGFYPTNLTTYIRNPLLFYQRKILQIREADEVEENIALNTLGTIIHETLRVMYTPFIGRKVATEDIEQMMQSIEPEVLNQFRAVYKMGEIRKGKNLLAFEVAKRNIYNFLKMEMEDLKNGDDLEIIALEQNFERLFEHPTLPYPVMLKGNVDRIERRNGIVRIIDYKTGKVEERDMALKDWQGLTVDIKNEKLVQVLAYAFICYPQFGTGPMEVGIISFKNMKCGFMPFNVKVDKKKISWLTDEIVANYLEQLAGLLSEILDPEIPFAEKIS